MLSTPVSASSKRSNPDILFGGPLAPFISCIGHTARLDKEQFDLALCVGLVLDPLRDDEHLSTGDMDCAITKIDPQRSFYNNERLVRIFMMMPDKISLQLHNLELVVHLRNDLRLPSLLEQREFLTEVDGLIAHYNALPSGQ